MWIKDAAFSLLTGATGQETQKWSRRLVYSSVVGFSWTCQSCSDCPLFLGIMNRRPEKQIGTVNIFQRQK